MGTESVKTAQDIYAPTATLSGRAQYLSYRMGGGKEVILGRLGQPEDKELLALAVKMENQHYSHPIYVEKTKLNDLFNLNKISGVLLNGKDIQELVNMIKSRYNEIELIPFTGENLGFATDGPNKVSGYNGAECIGPDGKILSSELMEPPLSKCGEVTTWKENIEKLMMGSLVTQTVLLTSLAAPVVGYLKLPCLILAVISKGRSGKTAAMKAAMTAHTIPTSNKVTFTFEDTDYSIGKQMDGNHGIGILIDDTSLGRKRKRNYQDFIYLMSKGGDVKRIERGKVVEADPAHTSILISGEKSLLMNGNDNKDFDFTLEGFPGRFIELNCERGDITKDAKHANDLIRFSQSCYGQAGAVLAEYILGKYTVEGLLAEYTCHLDKLRTRVEDAEGIMSSILEHIAVLDLTAGLVKSALNISFDINAIVAYLIETCQNNILNYQRRPYNIDYRKMYDIYVKEAMENFPGCQKGDGYIYLPSKRATQIAEKYSVNSDRLRSLLYCNHLLVKANEGEYTVRIKSDENTSVCVLKLAGGEAQ